MKKKINREKYQNIIKIVHVNAGHAPRMTCIHFSNFQLKLAG